MLPSITRQEALRRMSQPGWQGSIAFVTLDTKRTGKGGKESRHIRLKKAERVGASHDLLKHRQIGIKSLDGTLDHQVAVHMVLIMEVDGHLVS